MSEVHTNIVVEPVNATFVIDTNAIAITPTATQLSIYTGAAPAPIGGSNTQVQFNDDDVFEGDSTFTFNKTTSTLSVANLDVTTHTSLGDVANVDITGGTNGYVLQTDGAGNLSWTAQTGGGGGGNGTPGGSNTQIQYNDSGSFGGAAGFTFNESSNLVSVPGGLTAVGNLTSANLSITNTANIAGTTFLAGNVTSANLSITNTANIAGTTFLAGNIVTAGYYGNITGVNVCSAVTFVGSGTGLANITGANVTGVVPVATIADTANAVAGANVSGTVANATYALTAGGIAGANVTGTVANATYAITAGTAANATYATSAGNVNLSNFASVANSVNSANIIWSALGVIAGLGAGNGAGANIVCIGNDAGNNQGADSVAIGWNTNANTGAVSIGKFAGIDANTYAVAVGYRAGGSSGLGAVAIGSQAGYGAGGNIGQNDFAVAVGYQSSLNNQGYGAVAVGSLSGYTDQGSRAVSIGSHAGFTNQGANSIAIGNSAGYTNQAVNSIIINATGSNLNQTTANTFTVKPVRQANTSDAMFYNSTTGEITYDTTANITSVGTLSSLTVTGNVAAGNVSGTLTTAAQPNITSVGTIANLRTSGNVVLSNATNTGIQVDTTTPVWGWRDLLGPIEVRAASVNAPIYTSYNGTAMFAFEFANNKLQEAFINFHIPHDYVPGSEIFIHVHWSQTTVDTGGAASAPGVAKWYFDALYAKGHQQQSFPAAVTTVSVTQTASSSIRRHMIAEVQLSTSGAVGGNALEVDGLVMARLYRDPADVADTLNQVPYIHFVDIHYQSTNMATKGKAPSFY